jgi:hypothetical protein
MSKMGSYKICQGCLRPIVRRYAIVFKKANRYYSKNGKYFHPGCAKKVSQKKLKEIFNF